MFSGSLAHKSSRSQLFRQRFEPSTVQCWLYGCFDFAMRKSITLAPVQWFQSCGGQNMTLYSCCTALRADDVLARVWCSKPGRCCLCCVSDLLVFVVNSRHTWCRVILRCARFAERGVRMLCSRAFGAAKQGALLVSSVHSRA